MQSTVLNFRGDRGRKTRRSTDSLDADDLVCQCIMSLEALTVYEDISPEALTAEESIQLEALTPHVVACLVSFDQDWDVRFLNKAITLCEFAISRYPDGDVMQTDHFYRLGLALEKKGLEDKALGAYERALDLAPEESRGLELRSVCFYKIGSLHQGRYDQHGEAEDLNKAIWAHEMCIAFAAADGKHLDDCYSALFCSLKARWQLLKDEEDLDRLVSHAEKSIAFNPSYYNQFNLGTALCMSYDHHHTLALIDQAILAMRSAVSSSMPHHRMDMLTALGLTYYRRFHHVRDLSDASACIKYLEQAMEHGKLCFSFRLKLTECLGLVFYRNGDVQCYERARLVCETLLADDSLTNIDRTTVLMALGALFLVSFENRAPLPDPYACRLEKCIQTLKRAIECMPPKYPEPARPYYFLSYALHLQVQIGTPTVSEFEYAISIGRKAVEFAEIHVASERNTLNTNSHASCLQTLAYILTSYGLAFRQPTAHYVECVSLLDQASQISSLVHDTHLTSAIVKAEYCAAMNDWEGCFNACTSAMEAVQQQAWLGLSVVQQYRAIGGNSLINGVGSRAARTAVRFGNSRMALKWIEQCRSIVWRRVLNLRVSMDALANVEPTLAHRLKEVSDMLQRYAYFDLRLGMEEGSMEKRKQERYRLAEEWEGLIAQTRSLPGFTNFLKPKGAAYFTSCEFGGIVVLLTVYQKRCDVIVLGSNKGKIVMFPLEQMNKNLATTLQTRLRETLQQSGRHSRDTRASEVCYGHDRQDGMSTVLSVLWKTVVKPLFDFLDLKPHNSSSESDPPRLWWCPTGPLSFLPLHAAGLYDTTVHGTKVYEYVASSYTPTVGILADISNQRSEEFSGLLTVCQPHTPGQNPIPKTEDEVYSVVQVAVEGGLTITSLGNDEATPEAVLSDMAEHSWIHLACHARQDPTQPLESAFMLAGDPEKGRPLKLTEIADRTNTKADFAFLSACQTATGDASLSDESVHLAAGMLMAGYRRVIATMWAVNDSDAPIIAEKVYKHMLSDGKADSGKSCLALHRATASMRQERGEKNFMSWVPFIHYGA
ncbi:hypothetical protein ARMGADRAFT_37961 [Armillaria gallica]|uniref:CHAT domain-containing protein n=1 Tax=Armillaria gallica TaxID=47427 RepID=A0A2H3E945_ARMGA|nr:hypothetical protein ARMGADRAFT_37961 [Armillaria gallica]